MNCILSIFFFCSIVQLTVNIFKFQNLITTIGIHYKMTTTDLTISIVEI